MVKKSATKPGRADGPPAVLPDVTGLLGYRLFRLSNRMGRLAEEATREVGGLRLAEYRCLAAIAARRGMTVTDICALIHIDKAWVSRTLVHLLDKGLVAGRPDAADGRRTLYSATARGRKVGALLIAKAHERQDRLLAGLDAEQRAQLFDLLAAVERNIAETGPDALAR